MQRTTLLLVAATLLMLLQFEASTYCLNCAAFVFDTNTVGNRQRRQHTAAAPAATVRVTSVRRHVAVDKQLTTIDQIQSQERKKKKQVKSSVASSSATTRTRKLSTVLRKLQKTDSTERTTTRGDETPDQSSEVVVVVVAAAAAKEEDKQRTIQVIREFHALEFFVDSVDTTNDQDAVNSLMQVESSAAVASTSTSTNSINAIQYDEIVSKLSLPEYDVALKRIAAAYAPSVGHVIPYNVQKIDGIRILQLTRQSIEFGVLLCETGGDCVTIAVPVPFLSSPSTNGPEDAEAYIVQNLMQLYSSATLMIEEKEREEETLPSTENEEQVWNELQHYDASIYPVFPDWWTTQMGGGDVASLQHECSSVKRILNEPEFRSQVLTLAQQHHQQYSSSTASSSRGVVTHAGIALIGISGLYLRATSSDDSSSIEDIFVPFHTTVLTVTDHRDAIEHLFQ